MMYNPHYILYNYYSKYLGGLHNYEMNKVVPNLINTDIEFSSNDKSKTGGIQYSDAIAELVHTNYHVKGRIISIQDVNITKKEKGKLFKFNILPYNKNDVFEPLYAKGTYTAVYMIQDIHNIINDSVDNTYILRLASRNGFFIMFDTDKIKLEYKLFSEYLSKIYYYGSVPTLKFKTETRSERSIIDYNITKKYYTYDYRNPNSLTNQQKYKLLLSCLDMLYTLSEKSYVHLDLKLANIGWEDNEKMNVILIDYDYRTLAQMNQNDTNLFTKVGYKVILKGDNLVTTHPTKYVAEHLRHSYVAWSARVYDKYSVGGLASIIKDLNIKFNFNKLTLDGVAFIETESEGLYHGQPGSSIKMLDAFDMISSLKLDDSNYYDIPTYLQLYNLFVKLGEDGHIKDVVI